MARAILTANDFKSTPIPQGTVAWWLGTYASVPVGWEIAAGGVAANDATYTRPSLCSDRYAKTCAAVGDSPGTGGATTHAHTITSHNGHSQGSGGVGGEFAQGTNPPNHGNYPHSHNTMSAAADALSAANNDPPYVYAIPVVYTLKGGGVRGIMTPAALATGALPDHKLIFGWASSAPAPVGWAKCNGDTVNSVVTPNLLGKYLKGVVNTATNAGGTAGANTHSHDVSHTHTTGNPSSGTGRTGDPYNKGVFAHTHALGSQNPTTDGPNNEPPYQTLHYICFTGHGTNVAAVAHGMIQGPDLVDNLLCPRGLTAVWGFTAASKPSGWGHCDGGAWANGTPTGHGGTRPNLLSKFLKHVPNATTNGGGTGGNANHSHTVTGHSHTISGGVGDIGGHDGDSDTCIDITHDHTVSSTTWTNAPWTTSNDPANVAAIFVTRD